MHDPALVVRLYDEAERCGDVDMARATADAVAGAGEAVGSTLDGPRMLASLAAAPLRVYEPSYGVLFQGRALPPETTSLLQALQCELDAAETWLQASSSERTAGILRAAMLVQSKAALPDAAAGSGPDAAAAAAGAKVAPPGPLKAPSCEAPLVSALESVASEAPSAAGGPPRPAATDDDATVPWIVSVPHAIDEAVEREYNELMEASSTLRRRARAPPAAEVVSAFPLLLPVRPPLPPAAANAAGAAAGSSSSGGDAGSRAAEAARLAFGVTTVASTKAKAHLQV